MMPVSRVVWAGDLLLMESREVGHRVEWCNLNVLLHSDNRVALEIDRLEAITEEQWAEIWQRLRLHAWRRYKYIHQKLGLDLDDVVQQAIVDTLQGARRWPSEKVDIFSFLCGVVKSIISHQLEQEKRKLSIDSGETDSSISNAEMISLEAIVNGSIGEYLKYEAMFNRVVYDELTSKMYEMVKGDKGMAQIVQLWSKDPSLKPSDIAEELGLSMEELRNVQKRLRRKLKDLREVFSSHSSNEALPEEVD
jgi:DNA-directed RNA polymerase specialized sigma24 family protein